MGEGLHNDAWFDIDGAMQYLKISRTTLYAAMKDGRLAYFYIKGTRQRRLKKSDLDNLMVSGSPEDVEEEES